MPEKIKVLHIIKSLGRGGAEMLLPETLKLHNKYVFEFHYIYFLPWKDQMVNALENAGGRVTCFPANNNIQLMRQFGAVKRYIVAHNINLIHAHLPWAGFLSRLLFKSLEIPVLYTEHNKQERYHKITYWLNRWTFNSQSVGIAVSKDVEESIQKNINPDIPVKTILNGVNADYFQRNHQLGAQIRVQNNIPKCALVVGTVAVFRFQKRLIEWMKVFAQAADSNPDLYGIIVGDGPLKEELFEMRKQLGLEERLIMPGLQTNTLDWFSAMDIFMMTSVFEGLPIALLEAMSAGCAIATTDAGGIKEVLEDGVNGLMLGVDEWQKLSTSLKELEDPKLRKKLAIGGRQRILEGFSMTRMVHDLEELYGLQFEQNSLN